jgi:hypothetical protein
MGGHKDKVAAAGLQFLAKVPIITNKGFNAPLHGAYAD